MENKTETSINVKMTKEERKQLSEISRKVLGSDNISGLIKFWINKHKDLCKN